MPTDVPARSGPADGDRGRSRGRRAILAAVAAGATALAGCSGSGKGLDPLTSAPTPTEAPPTVTIPLGGTEYRTGEDDSLVIDVTVENPTNAAASGTVRLHFERANSSHEGTATFSLEPGAEETLAIRFPELNRSAVDGVQVNKELTVDGE